MDCTSHSILGMELALGNAAEIFIIQHSSGTQHDTPVSSIRQMSGSQAEACPAKQCSPLSPPRAGEPQGSQIHQHLSEPSMYTMQAVIPHSPAEPRAALTDTQLVSHLLRAKGGDQGEGGRETGLSFPEANQGQRKYY